MVSAGEKQVFATAITGELHSQLNEFRHLDYVVGPELLHDRIQGPCVASV